jgi:hypothetical protein
MPGVAAASGAWAAKAEPRTLRTVNDVQNLYRRDYLIPAFERVKNWPNLILSWLSSVRPARFIRPARYFITLGVIPETPKASSGIVCCLRPCFWRFACVSEETRPRMKDRAVSLKLPMVLGGSPGNIIAASCLAIYRGCRSPANGGVRLAESV